MATVLRRCRRCMTPVVIDHGLNIHYRGTDTRQSKLDGRHTGNCPKCARQGIEVRWHYEGAEDQPMQSSTLTLAAVMMR